ncbi:MAG TPA: porin, partial [Isosphaeraceae bacterium]|nr:porin [Isosphaeraceae bacterium]
GLNRDIGMMAWGQLFQKRLDYAAGIFNGTRNNYIDANSAKDFAGYVNFRPFGQMEGSILENFNIGGSVEYGNQLNAPVPQILRTNVATTGTSFYGVPFLAFNPNVIESGDRAFWDLHTAWYVGGLSLLAEWASGFQDYAKLATPFNRTHLPVDSFYAQAGYFITGEKVAGRGQVKPIRDFDIRKGKFGPGAIELAARYSFLSVGQQVFTAGLSDPNLWSRNNYLVDVGVNWYWTSSIKLYLGWQHAGFGTPVLVDPGRFQLTNDMLWARFQIYF